MKVLIVSHNPISTFQSIGKTLRTLLSACSPDELCQFYIYPSLSDVHACNSCYRMTDKEILRSYFFRRAGREILPSEIDGAGHKLFENEKDEALYRNRKNKTPGRMLLRDLMWKCSHWCNKSLRAWVEREKPTCIFLAPGEAKFLYNIALKLSKTYRLPIVTYICDDVYFFRSEKRLSERLRLWLLRRKVEQTLRRSVHLIAISRELEQAYSEKFGIPATTVMTGSSCPIAREGRNPETVSGLTYMGNIRYNRYLCLSEIGQELDAINAEKGTHYTLDLYTGEKNEEILAELRKSASIRLMGFVSGDEFDRVFRNADLLVHTEAFDEKNRDGVKFSVSTKIADCLAGGNCLFAYGPDSVASMRHLIDNNCAICATSREELREKLTEALENGELRAATVRNALETARRCHDSQKNGAVCREILERAGEEVKNG